MPDIKCFPETYDLPLLVTRCPYLLCLQLHGEDSSNKAFSSSPFHYVVLGIMLDVVHASNTRRQRHTDQLEERT